MLGPPLGDEHLGGTLEPDGRGTPAAGSGNAKAHGGRVPFLGANQVLLHFAGRPRGTPGFDCLARLTSRTPRSFSQLI